MFSTLIVTHLSIPIPAQGNIVDPHCLKMLPIQYSMALSENLLQLQEQNRKRETGGGNKGRLASQTSKVNLNLVMAQVWGPLAPGRHMKWLTALAVITTALTLIHIEMNMVPLGSPHCILAGPLISSSSDRHHFLTQLYNIALQKRVCVLAHMFST